MGEAYIIFQACLNNLKTIAFFGCRTLGLLQHRSVLKLRFNKLETSFMSRPFSSGQAACKGFGEKAKQAVKEQHETTTTHLGNDITFEDMDKWDPAERERVAKIREKIVNEHKKKAQENEFDFPLVYIVIWTGLAWHALEYFDLLPK